MEGNMEGETNNLWLNNNLKAQWKAGQQMPKGSKEGLLADKINKLWFINQLKNQEKTAYQMAKVLNLDPSAVSRMLSGDRKMELREAAIIAKFLGHSVTTIMEQAGIPLSQISPKETGMMRVFGTVNAKGDVSMVVPHEAPYVTAPANIPNHGIALRYMTDGTAFEYANGWVLYYEPLTDIPLDAIGRLCVVKVAGESDFAVRVIKRGLERGKYKLFTPWGEDAGTAVVENASPILWIKTSI